MATRTMFWSRRPRSTSNRRPIRGASRLNEILFHSSTLVEPLGVETGSSVCFRTRRSAVLRGLRVALDRDALPAG
jgi:hypothetical protein